MADPIAPQTPLVTIAINDMNSNPWPDGSGSSHAQAKYWRGYLEEFPDQLAVFNDAFPEITPAGLPVYGRPLDQGPQLTAQSTEDEQFDVVNHPSHYKAGGLEAIDVLEAFGLTRDGRLFNVGKYILRAGKKNDAELQDLKKARWYLDRYINDLENTDQ